MSASSVPYELGFWELKVDALMRIPSYDDLTPSIPDISVSETFAHLGRILLSSEGLARPSPLPSPVEADASSTRLFACLRSTGVPEVLTAIARDFSPRLERHGSACVVLDVSGLGRLLGDAQGIGAELDRAAADRAAGIRVAIAPTQTAARLMAIARPGLTIAAGDVAAALASLPIETLRALVADGGYDAGSAAGVQVAARLKATADRLATFRRWGLTTLGEVAGLPAADLSERMGQAGLVLQRLACGVDLAPLVPDPGVPRFIQSIELEWPIDALEPLSFVLARPLDRLSAALESADRGAAALRLDLRLTDRTMHARVLQLPAPIRDAKVLRTLLLLDLESHPPSAAIDIVTIEIDPAPARIIQYSLLERAMPSAETLATLTARLGALVGERRCGSPAVLDTYRPDSFEMRRFDRSLGEGGSLGEAGSNRKPEAFAKPEGQGGASQRIGTLILRRFRPPVAIRVTVLRGRPVRIAIDRRGMPGGYVEQQAGPWRTSGAWWDAASSGWDRDEWDVALSDGSLCRLFRDRTTGGWFLEGVLD
jgi:protein ImuB